MQNATTKQFVLDLEDGIESGERYTVSWKKNGFTGKEEYFKWRGTEPTLHLLYTSPKNRLRYFDGANTRTSCSLATRVQTIYMDTSEPEDAHIRSQGLHALASQAAALSFAQSPSVYASQALSVN